MSAALRQRALHGEEGSVLVIAVVLMSIMLAVGLSSFAFVDTGQDRAREQRERETSLNLTEAVLYSQGFALAQSWPGNAAGGVAMPTVCTSAAVLSLCPDPNTLAAGNSSSPASANFTNVDASSSVTWTTRIRDNGGTIADAFVLSQADTAQSGTNVKTGATYTCPGPCRWDANGDLKLWVQARAVVRGRPRNVVALLKREQFSEAFARNGVTAGSFETTNAGNKTIIEATGSQVVVRCTSTGAVCTDYNASKSQVLPATIVRDPATPPAMSAAQLARFKVAAQTASPSTYYTSCPASLTGTVVFIDVPTGTHCTDTNGAVYNSPTEPGIVIMPRGTLSMQGTLHGLVYMANEQGSSAAVLTLEANSEVFGGVAIDGPGRLVVGQASGPRPTITFVPNAFDSLATFGTTGLVQNTWRELPPN
jgi:type II secretory pathway pseudopilin PulG